MTAFPTFPASSISKSSVKVTEIVQHTKNPLLRITPKSFTYNIKLQATPLYGTKMDEKFCRLRRRKAIENKSVCQVICRMSH